MTNIAAFLSEVRLFDTLAPETLSRLAGQSIVQTVPTDTVVFYQGDIADRVYLVVSGEVAIETISTEGRTVSIASLGHHALLGEMAAIDGGARSANVRTLRETVLVSISRQIFLDLIDREPAFARRVLEDLVARIRETDSQIETITLKPLRVRLAILLGEMADAHGHVIKIRQAELAERLSATREKVNINLQALRQTGAIDIGRGRIDITNRTKLDQFIG